MVLRKYLRSFLLDLLGYFESLAIVEDMMIVFDSGLLGGKRVRVYWAPSLSKYRVRLFDYTHGVPEYNADSDYFTDDKQCAMDTAGAMLGVKVWYCHCCRDFVIRYCGTGELVGDVPDTKGKPCALQA